MAIRNEPKMRPTEASKPKTIDKAPLAKVGRAMRKQEYAEAQEQKAPQAYATDKVEGAAKKGRALVTYSLSRGMPTIAQKRESPRERARAAPGRRQEATTGKKGTFTRTLTKKAGPGSGRSRTGEGGAVTKAASIGETHHAIAAIDALGAKPVSRAHPTTRKLTVDSPARKAGEVVGRAPKPRYMAKTAKRMSKAGHRAATATTRFVSQTARKGTAVVSRLAKIAVTAAARFVAAVLSVAAPIAGVVIMAVCMGGAFMMLLSPLGIIGADENTEANTQRVRSVVADVDAEFYVRLEQIKAGNPHDTLVLTYLGSPDNVKINNWVDVIAVFAVKTALDDNGMDVVIIDEQRAALIRDVFWDMTRIDYWTEEIPIDFDDEGNPIAYEVILYITVESLTAQQQAANYDFNRDQLEILDLLLTEFRGELKSMVHAPGNWTPEQLEKIYNSLPEGTHAAKVVRLALSRLGDPYSIPLSGQGDYIDCSHLVQWCYAQVGIALPRTAAPQGKYCADNDLTIAKDELQPGDLVFWSYEPNGGYRDIGHVGIYVGEGMVVNASSMTMEVTLEPLFHADKQVLYGRPAAQWRSEPFFTYKWLAETGPFT